MTQDLVSMSFLLTIPHIAENIYLDNLSYADFDRSLFVCRSWRISLASSILKDAKNRAKIEQMKLVHYWMKGEIMERQISRPEEERFQLNSAHISTQGDVIIAGHLLGKKDKVRLLSKGGGTMLELDCSNIYGIALNDDYAVILGREFGVDYVWIMDLAMIQLKEVSLAGLMKISTSYEENHIYPSSHPLHTNPGQINVKIHSTKSSIFLSQVTNSEQEIRINLMKLQNGKSNDLQLRELRIMQSWKKASAKSRRLMESCGTESFEFAHHSVAYNEPHPNCSVNTMKLCLKDNFLAFACVHGFLQLFDHEANMIIWKRTFNIELNGAVGQKILQLDISNHFVVVSYLLNDAAYGLSVFDIRSGATLREVNLPVSMPLDPFTSSGKYLVYSRRVKETVENTSFVTTVVLNLDNETSFDLDLPKNEVAVAPLAIVKGRLLFVQLYSNQRSVLELLVFDLKEPTVRRQIYSSKLRSSCKLIVNPKFDFVVGCQLGNEMGNEALVSLFSVKEVKDLDEFVEK